MYQIYCLSFRKSTDRYSIWSHLRVIISFPVENIRLHDRKNPSKRHYGMKLRRPYDDITTDIQELCLGWFSGTEDEQFNASCIILKRRKQHRCSCVIGPTNEGIDLSLKVCHFIESSKQCNIIPRNLSGSWARWKLIKTYDTSRGISIIKTIRLVIGAWASTRTICFLQ